MDSAVAVEPQRQRPRYGYWLLASVPVALALDLCFAGFARFWWCGFNTCLSGPGDIVGTTAWVVAAGFVMFLAVSLPPWVPGWRRPVTAAGAGLLISVLVALFAFRYV